MRLQEFNYILPKELIAQTPLRQRDQSRLMILDRRRRTIEHACFRRIPDYLQKGDVLVANDTRVIPARIYGKKETGGRVELFILNFLENGSKSSQTWECLLKSRKKIVAPSKLYFSPNLRGEVLHSMGNGKWQVRLDYNGDFDSVLHETGQTPLPPYIKRNRNSSAEMLDRERYQTVYAANNGAVAAPTAGFHFTRRLIDKTKNMGAEFTFVTLHVGYGTFQPIREDNIEKHKIHKEYFQITNTAAEKINNARNDKRRIIAVGTTATRVLESVTRDDGRVGKHDGYTDLYIYPGYSFKTIDALITNFHLPKSSLLLLVAAFAGKEFIMRAYREAIEEKYRFFSYGDAMLIL